MAKIFISYSHDTDHHKQRVRELADYLRNQHHLDVMIDHYMLPGGPPGGWPFWSEEQVRDANKVLVVCTEAYCRRYLGREEPNIGLGAVCEARLIHQEIYDRSGINHKYRVILFDESGNHHVPDTLKAYHRFPIYNRSARDEMVDWLLGRTNTASATTDAPTLAWPKPASGYVWSMADRKDVTGRFAQMLSGQSDRQIVLVSAESNSGKTHMLGELKNYARKVGVSPSLLDCKGCPSLDDLLNSLVLDLGSVCPRGRQSEGKARAWNILEDLQQLAVPVLLIFDTYEKVSTDSQNWIETQLLPRTDRTRALTIVIAGQKVPDHSRHSWSSAAEHFKLEPIRAGLDWHEYTQSKGFNISLAEASLLASAGQGQPGLIYNLLESVYKDRQAAGHSG